jgi:sulfur-oxidizing protein SoxB
MDVDLKMASRVRGIDAIFGGHTHDGVPVAVPVKNAGGRRWSPTPAATASSWA